MKKRTRPRPYFSIVIPTYNRVHDVMFALRCLLRQTYTNFEVVISDNASTDDTQSAIKKIDDPRIRYFRNRQNIGLIGNQIKALHYARGTYVFLHGDDDFLPYADSLAHIRSEIYAKKPGYVRVNYASLALDNRHIFAYKVYKPFAGNVHLKPGRNDSAVLSFIVDSDHYFFSGIIFRNQVPRDIRMVNADPGPWISILFYLTKRYGGYFIQKRHILARWSRRTKKSEDHGFYAPMDGLLKAEPYFNEVKKLVSGKTYRQFLHRELTTIYVNLFPGVKVSVGSKKFREVARRVRALDPGMASSFLYWKNYMIAMLVPQGFLRIARSIFLFLYVRAAKVENEEDFVEALNELQFFSNHDHAGRKPRDKSK